MAKRATPFPPFWQMVDKLADVFATFLTDSKGNFCFWLSKSHSRREEFFPKTHFDLHRGFHPKNKCFYPYPLAIL